MTLHLGSLTLSDGDLAVIAHVVHNETPEEWATRAYSHTKGGEAAVKGKIAHHRARYLSVKDAPGYQTAAERMADRRKEAEAERVRAQTAAAIREKAEEEALGARIASEVSRQIAARENP